MLFTSLMYITATSEYADAQVGVHVLGQRSASCVNKRDFQANLRTILYVQRQQHDCIMLEWTNS